MSGNGAMQVSPEALKCLIDALQQYRARVDAAVSDITRTVSARLQRLNDIRDDAQREVHQRRDDLRACDENDDCGLLQSRLERAEERLDRIERRIGEVAETLGYFKRSRAGLQDSVSRGIPRAVGYLDAKHKELVEYLSVALPGEYGVTGTSRGMYTSNSIPVSTGLGAEDVAVLPLPVGFQWVRLEDISRSDDLRPEEKFSKVSVGEVENGFRLLKEELLPALQADPSRSADFFRQYDTEKNRAYAQGALRVYEAFFGESHIALTRHPGGGAIGVTNGRHRIQVARQLGWTSVPARLI